MLVSTEGGCVKVERLIFTLNNLSGMHIFTVIA